MENNKESWHRYWMPVAVCLVVFSAANFLANRFLLPHAITVYLISGSGVAMFFIAMACRAGAVAAADLGLASHAWKPQYRFFGLTLAVVLGYLGFSHLQTTGLEPAFADYCFWFVFLLPASLAELLVFVSIGFCLPEKWLKQRGFHPLLAIALAAAFSGVAFGLFHYTHDTRWHKYALTLIPVMWLDLLCFKMTRNFHLTLLLHNACAAVGFTQEQYLSAKSDVWIQPATYQTPVQLGMLLTAFVVPYAIWHVFEALLWRPAIEAPQEPPAASVVERTT